MFMTRFLLFVAFLNASVTVVLDCWRISFYILFFACFIAILKWKFLNFTVEKNLRALTWGQKVVRIKVWRSHCHSHLKSRENHTDSTSAQEAKQWAIAFTLTDLGQYQHCRTLHYIMGHWKLFIGEYFTYEHEEFCGPLGATVFTANINDCLRPVPMGIFPVLCESWPTFTLWDQGQLEKQLIPSCFEF